MVLKYPNGSPTGHDQYRVNLGSGPNYDSIIQNKAGEEARLLEQDPFMLEEQRYLDRLKLAQIKQNLNYDKMNQNYTIP